MKRIFLILFLGAITTGVIAQRKITTSATVKFDASTSIDDLPKAENKTVIASLNTTTGAVAFEAAVKNFAFSNPSIQNHFNGAKWLDSDKHPTFTFKGNIADLSSVNFSQDGVYKVRTDGIITVKGLEQKLSTPATITVKGGSVIATADFTIKLADFGITGSSIDGGKVAKEPKISVAAELK
jgi:polyisoprenoid-binding protein YceI